ncbi:MAG: GNAT family N-acetyltransferase [Oligoflexia bacterium]|nr:GNAT family N-acetyltransferase [Oligoflexia bacterium]
MKNLGEIVLRKLSKEEYLSLHELRNSEPYLKYDHPERPLASKAEEETFWEKYVISGAYLFWGIYTAKDIELVGVINAFSFSKDAQTCETGINIFPPQNFGKGHGLQAYLQLHEILLKELGIKYTYIMTSPENKPALKLYGKLGYFDGGQVDDEGFTWQVMKYKFGLD